MMTATLMVGVRVSDIFRVEEVTKHVTRYHEETGEPYQKPVITHKLWFLNKEVLIQEPSAKEWPYEKWWPFTKEEGITIGCPNCEGVEFTKGWDASDYRNFVLGRVVGTANGDDHWSAVLEIDSSIDVDAMVLTRRLDQLGFDGEVRTFVVAYASY